MTLIYGVCKSSLLHASQNIKPIVNNTEVLFHDLNRLKTPKFQKKLREADLILVENIRAYKGAFSVIQSCNKNPVIVIFDNPALLKQLPDMHIIDTKPVDNPLKYEFSVDPINYDTIIKACKSKRLPVVRERNNIDLLGEIIKLYTAGGLLDKFNTYIYMVTSPVHRMAVKTLLVQYIFGAIKVEGLKSGLTKYVTNSAKNNTALQLIIDYMNKPEGESLQKALQHAQKMENEANKSARRTIAYKKLADTYGVDSFELRNLIILYRSIK